MLIDPLLQSDKEGVLTAQRATKDNCGSRRAPKRRIVGNQMTTEEDCGIHKVTTGGELRLLRGEPWRRSAVAKRVTEKSSPPLWRKPQRRAPQRQKQQGSAGCCTAYTWRRSPGSNRGGMTKWETKQHDKSSNTLYKYK
jgi:hypothetical protein